MPVRYGISIVLLQTSCTVRYRILSENYIIRIALKAFLFLNINNVSLSY